MKTLTKVKNDEGKLIPWNTMGWLSSQSVKLML